MSAQGQNNSRMGIDADELASCVQCGLCLPHCPTWRLSGDENRSPRGRIDILRSLEHGERTLDDDAVAALSSCIQCRACEPACPSAVPFGHMIASATQTMVVEQPALVPRWLRVGLWSLGHPALTALATAAIRALGRMWRVPGAPRGLMDRVSRQRKWIEPFGSGDRVLLVRGCVMDGLQRSVHVDTVTCLEAVGFAPRSADRAEGCCGALAHHAGLVELGAAQATRFVSGFSGDAPIVTDSAGCGAHLKDLARVLGTTEAERFASRVRDVGELLADRADRLPLIDGQRPRVAVADPCHLRHVQRAHEPMRAVLGRVVELVDLGDDGQCCGAGGAWAIRHPQDAAELRDAKLDRAGALGVQCVVSGNPGCTMHLGGGPLRVSHPVEIIAEAIRAEHP